MNLIKPISNLSPGSFFALGHILIAVYQAGGGLIIGNYPDISDWDWIWQAIPLEDLRERPLSSLWYQHAQPPGYSIWGWFWLMIAGENQFPGILQWVHVFLCAGVVWMTCSLAFMLTCNRACSFCAGAVMMLNPSLFYFEAFILYEPIVIFLMTAAVWCLARAIGLHDKEAMKSTDHRWFIVWLVVLNILVLTRSLYHLIFLVGSIALLLVCLWRAGLRSPFHGMRRRRATVILVLSVIMPITYYTKNTIQYGFFGSSSWFGLSFYNCVIRGFDWKEQQQLEGQAKIPGYILNHYPYQHSIDEYSQFGYRSAADHPLLSRNDLHNINIPALSEDYGRAAFRLIRLSPGNYLRVVMDSYSRFCRPPSRFVHLNIFLNDGHVSWEPLYSQVLYGQALTDRLNQYFAFEAGSLCFAIFPFLMIAGCIRAGSYWRAGLSPGEFVKGGVSGRKRSIVTIFMIYCCLYVAVVGCLFENGENERFRFALEPAMLLLLIMLFVGPFRRRPLYNGSR